MTRSYHELLRYVFRRFSVVSARRTALPTLKYYLTRPALPHSEKPALFTMNILPPMMTVWYHLVRKYLGDKVDVTIFDCSGKLDPQEFPGARVQKFLNFYAATKCNEFLYSIARHRRIGWICDDDMFPLSPKMIDILEREFADPRTASVSFRPRSWWHFAIDGQEHEASGSYCLALNRSVFCDTEHLSLAPAEGNNHPSPIGKKTRRYDTFDKANEILLRKKYRCVVVPPQEREELLTGFSGISGGVMLLSYFRTPEETLNYFRSAPAERWSGNVLFGTLSAILAICTIQECYEKLKGRPYPLPSLPSRAALERIRDDHRQYLRPDHDLQWFDRVRERLLNAL